VDKFYLAFLGHDEVVLSRGIDSYWTYAHIPSYASAIVQSIVQSHPSRSANKPTVTVWLGPRFLAFASGGIVQIKSMKSPPLVVIFEQPNR
jgi:hypothetical protein